MNAVVGAVFDKELLLPMMMDGDFPLVPGGIERRRTSTSPCPCHFAFGRSPAPAMCFTFA